ncbi:MAG TPA: DUF4405 domain-containing protein [Syntrophales bacterium]|nr:DUF4405 domain-containing protein [Syntrophales bacterium]
MKKNGLKYVIDLILFVDICSIVITGSLLAFIIPEGRTGRASKYFLGLHRHDWGHIHLFLSLLLLLLLLFHIWLNWNWVVQSSKKYFGNHWKTALWCIAGAGILVLAIMYVATKIASV